MVQETPSPIDIPPKFSFYMNEISSLDLVTRRSLRKVEHLMVSQVSENFTLTHHWSFCWPVETHYRSKPSLMLLDFRCSNAHRAYSLVHFGALKVRLVSWLGLTSPRATQWTIANSLGFFPKDDSETCHHDFEPLCRGWLPLFNTPRDIIWMGT